MEIETSNLVEKQINIILALNDVELDRIHPELFPLGTLSTFDKREEMYPTSIDFSPNQISFRNQDVL